MKIGQCQPGFRFAPWALPCTIHLVLLGCFYRIFVFWIGGQRFWGTSDDIYISACYARTLAAGHGALWYPGAPAVEGFSNPLWVLLLTPLHWLPWFQESHLGLYLLGLNAAISVALWWLFWRVLKAIVARARMARGSDPPQPEVPHPWLCLVPALFLWSLAYWQAEGFEVGLIALLMLWGFDLALRRPYRPSHAAWLGVVGGLLFWTRMDAVLYLIGPIMIVVAIRPPRVLRLTPTLQVMAMMVIALFATRWFLYHSLLPNTYYLKLDGWPLPQRVRFALTHQGWVPLTSVLLFWGLLLKGPRWLRSRGLGLGGALRPLTAVLLTATASVLYSIHNGGDAWLLKFGYDRYTVIGQVALVLLVTSLLGSLWQVWPGEACARLRGVTLPAAVLLVFLPIALDPWAVGLLREIRDRMPRRRELRWIQYGAAFEKVSLPGARIGICPAGAIIYFSHRCGLDLLGKMEPFVARKSVNQPEATPGHNKRYETKAIHKFLPDFAREKPGRKDQAWYRAMRYGGYIYWVRYDTPYARWDLLRPVPPAAPQTAQPEIDRNMDTMP